MTTPPPIGTPPLWTAVVDRDGGQCTCTGGCGRRHTTTGPATARPVGRRARGPGANAVPGPVARCTAGAAGAAGERLLVVPADPATRDSEAWKLPATALTTRCEPCARSTTARARRASSSGTGPAGSTTGSPGPPAAAVGADQPGGQLSLLDLDTPAQTPGRR